MRIRALFLLALGLMLPVGVRAQVELIDGLGGPQDYGTSCLAGNDDGSSSSIDLTSVFPDGLQFFDTNHRAMFVNTNGNITFSGALPTYTPEAFPVASQPMIAPFWADVDIRTGGAGDCIGGIPIPGFPGGDCDLCHNPEDNGVWWAVDAENRRVVVTWDQVGYFNQMTDLRMNFQLVLTPAEAEEGSCSAGGDFDVEFRFNRCEWNAGSASMGMDGISTAGTAAQSGFDAGNSMDFVEIEGSRDADIHTRLCTMSNVEEPGIWRFSIRAGVIECPGAGEACETGLDGVCADGFTRCVGDGIQCVAVTEPTTERCDNIDNDCDGMVDDGEDICPGGGTCDDGVCIRACFEDGCPAGLGCDSTGACVEAECVDVACAEGEVCRGGECVGPCGGIECPEPLSCRMGQCVDLCAGQECDACTVCVDGACVENCTEESCAEGEVCTESGECLPADCADVTCGAGTVCRAGACVDPCDGAVCPTQQMCEAGRCVDTPPPVVEPPPVDPPPVDPPPMTGECSTNEDCTDGRYPVCQPDLTCRCTTDDDCGEGLACQLPEGFCFDPGTEDPDAGVDGSLPPPTGRRTSGCGCHVKSPDDLAGDVLLMGLVGLFLMRRKQQ